MIDFTFDTELSFELLMSFLVGVVIGLERQYKEDQQHHFGSRSASILAIVGTIAAHYSELAMELILFASVVVGVVVAMYLYFRFSQGMPGLTTAFTIVADFFVGVVIGFGHIAMGIVVALLLVFILSIKKPMHEILHHIRYEEIVSAAKLGVLALLLYPIIPEWQLGVGINVRLIYQMFLVILIIMFLAYIFVREFGEKGLFIFSFVGSFVHSEATVLTLTKRNKEGTLSRKEYKLCVAIVLTGLLIRTTILIALLAGNITLIIHVATLILGTLPTTLLLTVPLLKSEKREKHDSSIQLPAPYEIKSALKFVVIFFLISISNTILINYGYTGLLIGAAVGGFVNAAATVLTYSAAYVNGVIGLNETMNLITIALIACIMNKFLYVKMGGGDKKLLAETGIIFITDAVLVAMVYFFLI